jgi:hypothetical protein
MHFHIYQNLREKNHLFIKTSVSYIQIKEEETNFEDSEGAIRSRKPKDKQYNGPK